MKFSINSKSLLRRVLFRDKEIILHMPVDRMCDILKAQPKAVIRKIVNVLSKELDDE